MSKVSHEEFAKVIEELAENGVSLSRLSEELGLCRTTLSKAKERRVVMSDISRLASLLRGKAKRLKTFDPDKHSLDTVLQQSFLKKAELAKRIGVSRQALNRDKDKVSDIRAPKIESKLHQLGEKIESLAFILEKIRA